MTKPVTKRARPHRCKVCGTPIVQPATGRPRLYCRPACRQRAHAKRITTTPVYWRHDHDEWTTPKDRFAEWHAEFGFTLDTAATADNALCPRYFTAEEDGLRQAWIGVVWCNPPYSQVAKWVEKGYREAQEGATVVMLVAARTDTRWWHNWAVKADEIRYIKGRLKFGGANSSAPFPSALLVFRCHN